MDENNYSKYQLKLKIAKRILMEKDKYRIIPVSDIVGRAFGLNNTIPLENNADKFDNSAIIVHPSSTWSDLFLEGSE